MEKFYKVWFGEILFTIRNKQKLFMVNCPQYVPTRDVQRKTITLLHMLFLFLESWTASWISVERNSVFHAGHVSKITNATLSS